MKQLIVCHSGQCKTSRRCKTLTVKWQSSKMHSVRPILRDTPQWHKIRFDILKQAWQTSSKAREIWKINSKFNSKKEMDHLIFQREKMELKLVSRTCIEKELSLTQIWLLSKRLKTKISTTCSEVKETLKSQLKEGNKLKSLTENHQLLQSRPSHSKKNKPKENTVT